MIPSREEKEKIKETRMRKGMCLNIAKDIILKNFDNRDYKEHTDAVIINIIDTAEQLYKTLEQNKYWGEN